MSNTDTLVPVKNILFIRNGVEEVISVAATESSVGLQNTIKVTFGLAESSHLALRNIHTNVILGDIQAAYLWSDPNANPKYRVLIFEDQQPQVNWCRWWWRQIMLPFFIATWDFCVNVLAGVVASTIFIEDNKLVKGRTFWVVLLIIVLKVVNTKFCRKCTGQKVDKFMETAHAATPIPTGARP